MIYIHNRENVGGKNCVGRNTGDYVSGCEFHINIRTVTRYCKLVCYMSRMPLLCAWLALLKRAQLLVYFLLSIASPPEL